MKDVELLLNAGQTISDDRIIEAIAFYIHVDAIGKFFVGILFTGVIAYGIYKVVKFLFK